MTTLLSLVQSAAGEMGLAVPALVAGSTNRDTLQLLALINSVGRELSRQYQWEALSKEYRFTTSYVTTTGTTTNDSAVVTGIPSTAGISANTFMVVGTGINQDTYVQSVDSSTQVTLSQACSASGTNTLNFCQTKYSFPSDYDRPTDRTQWDKSKHWEMLGPETAQQWQWLKSGFIATGPRIRFRPLGSYFQTWPPVSTNEYLGFEYTSKNWVLDASGTGKTTFTVDTDTCIFPDDLMILGLKMKYFEVKGFDPTAYTRDYYAARDIAWANDAGSKTLSLAPRPSDYLIGWDQIPDTGYGT